MRVRDITEQQSCWLSISSGVQTISSGVEHPINHTEQNMTGEGRTAGPGTVVAADGVVGATESGEVAVAYLGPRLAAHRAIYLAAGVPCTRSSCVERRDQATGAIVLHRRHQSVRTAF